LITLLRTETKKEVIRERFAVCEEMWWTFGQERVDLKLKLVVRNYATIICGRIEKPRFDTVDNDS
jgi:hypothetical protein